MLLTPFYCTPFSNDRSVFSSLKIQRDKLKQYQKKVGTALLPPTPGKGRNGPAAYFAFLSPFL
jgi:hypothetical protein